MVLACEVAGYLPTDLVHHETFVLSAQGSRVGFQTRVIVVEGSGVELSMVWALREEPLLTVEGWLWVAMGLLWLE